MPRANHTDAQREKRRKLDAARYRNNRATNRVTPVLQRPLDPSDAPLRDVLSSTQKGQDLSVYDKMRMVAMYRQFEERLEASLNGTGIEGSFLYATLIADLVGIALGVAGRTVLKYKRLYDAEFEKEGRLETAEDEEAFCSRIFSNSARGIYERTTKKLTEEYDQIVKHFVDSRMHRGSAVSSKHVLEMLTAGEFMQFTNVIPLPAKPGKKRALPGDADDPGVATSFAGFPADEDGKPTLSMQTVRLKLRELGFHWTDVEKAAQNFRKNLPYAQEVCRRFIPLYYRLRDQELRPYRDAEGKWCVNWLLFFDETFIHRYAAGKQSWIMRDVPFPTRAKGDRFCIVGFISTLGVVPGSFQTWAGKVTGDYHEMMNGEKFIEILDKLQSVLDAWWLDDTETGLKHLIMSNLQDKPVGFTGIDKLVPQLMMDNAPYHKKVDEDKIFMLSQCKTTKTVMVDTYMRYSQNGYPQEILDAVAALPAEDTAAAVEKKRAWLKKKTNVVLKDMLGALHSELRNQHGNRIYKAFNHIFAKGWHVYTTPPYHPEFQPIELCWNAGKAKIIASSWMHCQNKQAMEGHIVRTFESFNPQTIQSFVAESKRHVDEAARVRGIQREQPYVAPTQVDLQVYQLPMDMEEEVIGAETDVALANIQE